MMFTLLGVVGPCLIHLRVVLSTSTLWKKLRIMLCLGVKYISIYVFTDTHYLYLVHYKLN